MQGFGGHAVANFGELMVSLGREIGLPLDAEVSSPVEIRIDDLLVTLTAGDPSGKQELLFCAALGIVPEARETEAYRVMLDANVYWTATAGCTLGVNADTREAMLCFRAPMEALDGRRLAEVLETFVYVAGNWANFTEGLSSGNAVAESTDYSQVFIRI